MNTYRKLAIAAGITASMAVFSPGARAQLLEEKMTVKFSAPVEVPGEVLPAGTYVFEALQDGTLTRILSADESRVYATVFTVPDEKTEAVEKPTVSLEPSATQGSPERVDSWFYPGESTGNEFIYRKVQAQKILAPFTDAAKGIEHSSEFIGEHAAHIAAKVGKAVI
jgi:hypothetical protein